MHTRTNAPMQACPSVCDEVRSAPQDTVVPSWKAELVSETFEIGNDSAYFVHVLPCTYMYIYVCCFIHMRRPGLTL